jgi:hypothetical protein
MTILSEIRFYIEKHVNCASEQCPLQYYKHASTIILRSRNRQRKHAYRYARTHEIVCGELYKGTEIRLSILPAR